MKKALAVFSGGLDSMLAASIVKSLGLDVLAIFFETPFFSSRRAKQSALHMGIPLKVIDVTASHLEVVKNPVHGYGGNMNPCIDCHAFMIRKAGEMLDQENAHFLISGEVLGQRPMSQNRDSLAIVASESGFQDLLVRPLSARLLTETVPEKNGWIDREKLMDISGRSRKQQMALAERFGITDYPSPAGGCLLTDKVFSNRLLDLFQHRPVMELRELDLLKLGRHFRLGDSSKLIVGRNQKENKSILALAEQKDMVIQTITVPGPTALLVGNATPETEKLASEMTASYSDAEDGEIIDVKISMNEEEKAEKAEARQKKEFRKYMV